VQLDGFTGMVRLLAGDIGGTNTRLRLEEFTTTGAVKLYEESYPSADPKFKHLNDIVTQFLEEAKSPSPEVACFAIAGPVQDDRGPVTNVPQWGELNAHDMEGKLSIEQIRLINDFVAIGYGIPALDPKNSKDLVALQDRPAVPKAVSAVLGAGTGLGEALRIYQEDHYQVIATEGGHADYAPRTYLEFGLLQFLRSLHKDVSHGHVSVERVVSGPGIFDIYKYLQTLNLTPASIEVAAQISEGDPTNVIARHATDETDSLCVQAFNLFVSNYGAEARSLALKSLPYGGLYLAGGVAERNPSLFQSGVFIESFLDNFRMRPILEKLPVLLITNPHVGLMGAALHAQTLIPHE
jgi:glucokinase